MNKESRKKKETDARRRVFLVLEQIDREATGAESQADQSKLDEPGFVRRIQEEMRRLGKSEGWRFDSDGFALVDPDGGMHSLATAYSDYCRAPAAYREEILAQAARIFAQGVQALPNRYEDALPKLSLVVHRRSNSEVQRLQRQLGKPGVEEFAREVRADHLTITLGYDLPETVQYVTTKDLDQWGVRFDMAETGAEVNLRDMSKPPFVEPVKGLHVSDWNPYYGASRMMLLDEIRELPVRGPHIAMIPHRSVVLVTGADDVDGLLRMATWREPPTGPYRPIGGIAFRLGEHDWTPWLPPEDHPVYRQFRMLHIQTLVEAHDRVTPLIEKVAAANGEEVYVTFLMWRLDKTGVPRSYALVAQEDGDTILPQADDVGFIIAGESASDMRVLAGSTWQRVQEVLGERLEPMDGYPPRYRIRSFPTARQLQSIGIA